MLLSHSRKHLRVCIVAPASVCARVALGLVCLPHLTWRTVLGTGGSWPHLAAGVNILELVSSGTRVPFPVCRSPRPVTASRRSQGERLGACGLSPPEAD